MEFNAASDDLEVFESSSKQGGDSLLKSLKEELAQEVRSEPIVLAIPSREGMSMKYDTNIEAGTVQMWRKMSQNKSMLDNFDGLRFACLVLARQAEELIFRGKAMDSEDGEPINFKNPKFLEMLDAPKAVEGVRKLYGVDGHIFIAANQVLTAAGYDSDGQEQMEDPTLLS